MSFYLYLGTLLYILFLIFIFSWVLYFIFFFFSSRRRHTRYWRDWSSDVCSSDLFASVLPATLCTRHWISHGRTGQSCWLYSSRFGCSSNDTVAPRTPAPLPSITRDRKSVV